MNFNEEENTFPEHLTVSKRAYASTIKEVEKEMRRRISLLEEKNKKLNDEVNHVIV